jgi:glycosyltransferase involved in cell wall biosynthesis
MRPKLKILLATRSLGQLGGSEVWTATIAKALRELGHDVTVASRDENTLLPDFPKVRLERPQGHFDLGLFNHVSMLNNDELRARCGLVVQTCHGVVPGEEKPHPKADVHVAVSEEVLEAITGKQGVTETYLIRNPINTSIFRPETALHSKPKTILYMSNNGDSYSAEPFEKAAKMAGSQLVKLGRAYGRSSSPQIIMNQVDLVISLGRGAYEAMACGRPVVVADKIYSEGYLYPGYLAAWRKNNLSGRYNKYRAYAEWLAAEIAHYNPAHGPVLRDMIAQEHDHMAIAKRYLSILEPY